MLTYGYKAQNKADTMVNLLNETMDQVAETSGATNTFLVDIFPIRKFSSLNMFFLNELVF